MGDDTFLPDGSPPVRAEILRDSERMRVTRLWFTGCTVIRKEPLGPEAPRRLQHEVAILQRLRGVHGLAQLLDEPQCAGSIVLADAGESSVAGLSKPLPVQDLIGLALKLAGAVAQMHARGVIHRDICPANIVIADNATPCLVGFGLATSAAQIRRPEFTPATEIVGTLAYLAPEQTGRTGRSVDQRADLYALGATLYELATGDPPFGSRDPLRLIHDHLARVPEPPAQTNPAIPQQLSSIVMHLLEKEPDNRYQSAEGLIYDLQRLDDTRQWAVGSHDFPARLLRPSRLVGRDDEVAALGNAFAEMLDGRCRGVLVSGAPGAGKTALVDELRPLVADAGGWFIAGKFDQYRRDLGSDAVAQALRALCRLLLTETEEALAEVRDRIRAAVGQNAGLLAAAVPEFGSLLQVSADAGDPLTAQARAQRTAAQLLGAIASPTRPVVVFLDDMQWAGRTPLGFVDVVVSEEPIDGLLLVGAYRDDDVAATQLLAAMVPRWRDQPGVHQLRLDHLPPSSQTAMVADMLHLNTPTAADLVGILAPYTSGNPYEVIELLNGLRGQRALTVTAAGWRWDEPALRAHLSRSDVADLLAARIHAMPAPTREMVQAMACLGGRTDLDVLRMAVAELPGVVEQRLAPALDEAVLVIEPAMQEAVRFGHDRIREEVLRGLNDEQRRGLHLTIARRLAGIPEMFAVAAEQYLPVIDAVGEPTEKLQVVGLLRRAASQASVIGDYVLVGTLLAAALRLADPSETDTLLELHTARHGALYGMGRLDEAEEEYRAIEALCRDPIDLAGATAVQVRSLTHANRLPEAIELGRRLLRELGIAVPTPERLPAELDSQFAHVFRWLDATEAVDDMTRHELTDPERLACSRVMNAMLPAAAFVLDAPLGAWLSMQALRVWVDHGPARTLVGPAAHIPHTAAALRGEYAVSYRALRRVLAVSEARGYEPETSQARFLFAMLMWWFEPLEAAVEEARRAKEGLVSGGDLDNAGYSFITTMAALLDCASSLEACVAELDEGLAFVRRIGGGNMVELLKPYQWVIDALRGECRIATGEAVAIAPYGNPPLVLLLTHSIQAMAAAIFCDQAALERHTAEVLPLLWAASGQYASAMVRVLRGLALAGEVRTAGGDAPNTQLTELDEVTRWLAARAADAPQNFLHLLRWLEAERAWAVGEFQGCVRGFDAALREAGQRQRPWHRALIAERATRFYLAHGLDHNGYELLTQARQQYAAWGATAKVAQLDWAYPSLPPHQDTSATQRNTRSPDDSFGSGSVSTGTIDLMGILSTSQALSSETSIGGLHARVVQVLAAMTGATDVALLVWNDEDHHWLLPATSGEGGTSISDTGPASVLRYLERTREPLVVPDATSDARFARDPYFADADCCSLMALPILSRGRLRAVLLLENRLIRGAFNAERLDAVKLIAGQLAVSLDNTQLYSELAASRARIVATADQTRRRIERNLHDGAQQRLVSLALELRMAQAEVSPDAGQLRTRLDRAADQASGALEELRELSRGIHPAILTKGGLGPALRALTRRSSVPVQLDLRVEERLPESIEISAYYIVAEALTNAAKHSYASAITVTVEPADAALRLAIADDGVGGLSSLAAAAWSGSRTGPRRSAAASICTAPKGPERLCESPFRSPNRTAIRPASHVPNRQQRPSPTSLDRGKAKAFDRFLAAAVVLHSGHLGRLRLLSRLPPFLKWVLSKRRLGGAWRCPVGDDTFLPDGSPPVRAEIVHDSERTRVTRLWFSGCTVIRKELLGPDAERQLQREVVILQRLRGVVGVAQLLDEPQCAGSIVLADAGESSVAGLSKPLPVHDLIGLALKLAGAVAGMHACGVIHRDICPANIVIDDDGAPCLVDFGLATPSAQIRSPIIAQGELVGTLAYLAPEQTGRTGRSVDQRADLYGLGATLYELATGEPPFGSGDPLALIYDHLARVPVPPAQTNPLIPQRLSAIVMHLLEKEPDNRYQSAEGLLYDLQRLDDAGGPEVGGHDFPVRLLRPSRLVGRDDEVAALGNAFAEMLDGRCHGVLVSGAPGVGKTALVDQLRSLVAEAGGWFIAGKFDQYRRDRESDAVHQASRALCRMLLAQPEDELAEIRDRIRAAVGHNAGLLAAAVPEFGSLLQVSADAGDPLTAQARAQRMAAQLLGAVASPSRPVVLFLDDMQWAGRAQLGFVDVVLGEQPTYGALLVGAYRDGNEAVTQLIGAMVPRWREQPGVHHLWLDTLPPSSVVAMVADILRVDTATAMSLAEILAPHASGNPYEVVELLNALRSEGALTVTGAGWCWDESAVRAHLRSSDIVELLAARLRAMPEPTNGVVQAMACLGGRADLDLLQVAVGEPAELVEQRLAPALDEGVLAIEPGVHEAVQFGHDRIREVVLRGLDEDQLRRMHLKIARRLAAIPGMFAVAAEQYLPVIDAVDEPTERSHVVGLLRHAADQASVIGDYAMMSALLAAALSLVDPSQTGTLLELRTARHAALYGMGRLDEADEEYGALEALCCGAIDLADATAVQVRSLTHARRLPEAIALGLKVLAQLGIAVSTTDGMTAELDQQFDNLSRWLDANEADDDLARRELTDPTMLAGARLINAMLPAAYFGQNPLLMAWLSQQALRMWLEHGPSRTLVGAIAGIPVAAAALRHDYTVPYRMLRQVVALSGARGYEPETSQARFHLTAVMWCLEPLENIIEEAERAKEGLISGGDLDNAAYTFAATMRALLDCAPALDACIVALDAGLAFVRRIGGGNMAEVLECYQWVIDALRGVGPTATGGPVSIAGYSNAPATLLLAHSIQAMAAAVFGDQAALEHHTAEVPPLMAASPTEYPGAVVRVLRGLALAGQLRATDAAAREPLLSELDEITRWLADRAIDAPQNFLHLLRLLEAERAWAVGDFHGGVRGFDGALREAGQRPRPWHRALITERAARFYLAHGIHHNGYDLLAQARQHYAAWGAKAKVAQLDWAYPSLPAPPDNAGGRYAGSHDSGGSGSVSTGTIDLLGILSASQALSAETSIAGLHARVAKILAAMTGATDVALLVWNDEDRQWLLPAISGVGAASIGDTAPMSVLRYLERTREPLAVADATRDERFAADPFFADTDCCSLLAVPIVSRGLLRAVLLLENRLMRAAFTVERLSAVNLIAGQLTVSLDNAQLYTELAASRARVVATADQTRRRIERDLHDGAQQRLVSLALRLRVIQDVVPEPGEARTELDRAVAEASGALEELRELSRGIHPAILTENGLGPALRGLRRRSPIPVQLDLRIQERLPDQVEVSAYYIIAEALTNAAKHSYASAITVTVEPADAALRLEIADDGVGGAEFARGSGLIGLKDRARGARRPHRSAQPRRGRNDLASHTPAGRTERRYAPPATCPTDSSALALHRWIEVNQKAFDRLLAVAVVLHSGHLGRLRCAIAIAAVPLTSCWPTPVSCPARVSRPSGLRHSSTRWT
ncbi:MAG: AAA family ATPase [Mycobacterium sp.]|uniref:AAA family ATPase n=1 Tax=Mycobacterium sp. TaxID=1785 RepID=UPI003F9A6AA5